MVGGRGAPSFRRPPGLHEGGGPVGSPVGSGSLLLAFLLAFVLALPTVVAGQTATDDDAPEPSSEEVEERDETSPDPEPPDRERWLTDTRHFSPLLADPREPAMKAGLVWTNLFTPTGGAPFERPPFHGHIGSGTAREVQGDVSLGGHLPLWEIQGGPGAGVVVGVEAGVFGRFRLQLGDRDLISSDWIVSLPVEASRGPFSGRVRIRHWSAHLGDETVARTGARPISYSFDLLDLQVAYAPVPGSRLYLGGSQTFNSTTNVIRGSEALDVAGGRRIQAGVEGTWSPFSPDSPFSLVTALDWERSAPTGWRDRLTALAGIQAERGGRTLRIQSRVYDGPSAMGQFFASEERLVGIEARARW